MATNTTTKLIVYRGITYTISGNYQEDGVATDITGSAIRFTVKEDEWDTDADDSDALIFKSGSIVSASGGTYAISLSDIDTYLTPGSYYWDIKIELASGTIHRLEGGIFILKGTPTNRTS